MHKPTQTTEPQRQAWTAPRLSRLGTITDIAGQQGGTNEPPSSNKT